MKKRIASILILFAVVLSCIIPICINANSHKGTVIKTEMIEMKSEVVVGKERVLAVEVKNVDTIKIIVEQMQGELLNIEHITDKREWFIKYKNIINKYSYVLDPPETIYDCYSDEEVEILHRIVEAECEGLDFERKVNVANVIFNRINSEQYQNTVEEVVFQTNPVQFSPTVDGRYYSVKPQSDTLLAIEYAYMFPDTTDGALNFEAVWSDTLSYLTPTINDGKHKFYK